MLGKTRSILKINRECAKSQKNGKLTPNMFYQEKKAVWCSKHRLWHSDEKVIQTSLIFLSKVSIEYWGKTIFSLTSLLLGSAIRNRKGYPLRMEMEFRNTCEEIVDTFQWSSTKWSESEVNNVKSEIVFGKLRAYHPEPIYESFALIERKFVYWTLLFNIFFRNFGQTQSILSRPKGWMNK